MDEQRGAGFGVLGELADLGKICFIFLVGVLI